jgi:hypothetical protein
MRPSVSQGLLFRRVHLAFGQRDLLQGPLAFENLDRVATAMSKGWPRAPAPHDRERMLGDGRSPSPSVVAPG